MTKNFAGSAGPDNGFGRFNIYSGHENIISTNDIDEFLVKFRAFLTSEPWEPDGLNAVERGITERG